MHITDRREIRDGLPLEYQRIQIGDTVTYLMAATLAGGDTWKINKCSFSDMLAAVRKCRQEVMCHENYAPFTSCINKS